MHIRQEQEDDFKHVEILIRECFWNLYQQGADQHFLTHQLRKTEDHVKPLSLLVEQNKEIIGYIIYSKSKVTYTDGSVRPTITFGPVCVDQKHQQKGVGSLLIKQSLKKAKSEGHKTVIILGHPSVYLRFGFKPCKEYCVKYEGVFPLGCMILELEQNYLPKNVQGSVSFSPVFNINQQELQEYDKQFAPKQKFLTKSQQIFQTLVALEWGQPYDQSLKDAFNRTKIEEPS